MSCTRIIAPLAIALAVIAGIMADSHAAPQTPATQNDYPTSARADYVLGRMAANGNKRETLFQCSCAIDTIAGLMPYSDYEKAETALSLQTGGRVLVPRSPGNKGCARATAPGGSQSKVFPLKAFVYPRA